MSNSSSTPGTIRGGIWLVAALIARQICWSRRTLVLMFMLIAPSIVAVLVRSTADPGAIDDFYRGPIANLQLTLLPLLCLFYGSSLIRDGMENHTITYLLTRPIGRRQVVFGHYLGLLAFLLPLTWINIFIAHGVVQAGRQEGLLGNPEQVDLMIKLLIGATFAVPFYTLLYLFIGVAVRFPTIVGLIAFSLLDLGFGFLTGPPRALSPAAHIEEILGPEFYTRANEEELNAEPMGAQAAAIRLTVAWVALLFLTARVTLRKDFMVVSKAQS